MDLETDIIKVLLEEYKGQREVVMATKNPDFPHFIPQKY